MYWIRLLACKFFVNCKEVWALAKGRIKAGLEKGEQLKEVMTMGNNSMLFTIKRILIFALMALAIGGGCGNKDDGPAAVSGVPALPAGMFTTPVNLGIVTGYERNQRVRLRLEIWGDSRYAYGCNAVDALTCYWDGPVAAVGYIDVVQPVSGIFAQSGLCPDLPVGTYAVAPAANNKAGWKSGWVLSYLSVAATSGPTALTVSLPAASLYYNEANGQKMIVGSMQLDAIAGQVCYLPLTLDFSQF